MSPLPSNQRVFLLLELDDEGDIDFILGVFATSDAAKQYYVTHVEDRTEVLWQSPYPGNPTLLKAVFLDPEGDARIVQIQPFDVQDGEATS